MPRCCTRRWTAPRPRASTADEVKKIKGVTHVAAAAVRRRRGRRYGPGDRARPLRAQGEVGRGRRKAAPFDSEKAKEEYAQQGQGPERQGDGALQGRRRRQGARRRGQDAGGRLLVGAQLPRPDGADERRRQGRRRRPVGGDLGRHAGAAARARGGGCRRAQDHARQDQDPPATARRRLRPAHLAGRSGAGGGASPTSSRSR